MLMKFSGWHQCSRIVLSFESRQSSRLRCIITPKSHYAFYKYFRICLFFLPGAWPRQPSLKLPKRIYDRIMFR